MENFTMVEVGRNPAKKTSLAIRPFFDPNLDNMGLQNYGITLFDGVVHSEQLACIERNGVVQYLTGLNEFAPDIKLLNPEDKEARVKQIREAVIELEKELAAHVIDVDDPQFWNKITIACGNEPLYLNPDDPYDRIKLYAIEAGGFSIVAKSFDDARSKAVPPKFYLDKTEETAMFRTEYKKMRNKALSELQKLFDKNS
ncbi:MAG: hypothetical protein ACK5P0_01890, partial [bacterium]